MPFPSFLAIPFCNRVTPFMPLFSVFTPTHDPQYLCAAYYSLLAQSEKNWEWVIAPNNLAGATIDPLILRDKRVVVLPEVKETKIGALKRACCDAARGQIFVELDHDDSLAPNALREILTAVSNGAGFTYSDCAEYRTDSSGEIKPHTYNETFGWETYECWLYGWPMSVTRMFPANARSVCEIFYAPNHLRSWTRDAYYKAGGHDPSLSVGDDHDLICRTYIELVPFRYIPKALYFYRLHDKNTIYTHNKAIQQQNQQNKEKYIDALITAWCTRTGCASIRVAEVQAGIWPQVAESARGYPVGVIDVTGIEYVDSGAAREAAFEAWRLLTPGGWYRITTKRKNMAVPIPNGFQLVHVKHCDDHDVLYLSAIKGQKQPGWVVVSSL